jgi:hypothetical protein
VPDQISALYQHHTGGRSGGEDLEGAIRTNVEIRRAPSSKRRRSSRGSSVTASCHPRRH